MVPARQGSVQRSGSALEIIFQPVFTRIRPLTRTFPKFMY
jgi:hypothetical protein